MNVLFVVNFFLGKYSLNLLSYQKHQVFLKKMNVLFVVNFFLGKYSFNLRTF